MCHAGKYDRKSLSELCVMQESMIERCLSELCVMQESELCMIERCLSELCVMQESMIERCLSDRKMKVSCVSCRKYDRKMSI